MVGCPEMEMEHRGFKKLTSRVCEWSVSFMGSMGEVHDQAPSCAGYLLLGISCFCRLGPFVFPSQFVLPSGRAGREPRRGETVVLVDYWQSPDWEGHSGFMVQCSFCFLPLPHRKEQHFRTAPLSLQVFLAIENMWRNLDQWDGCL